MVCFNSAGLNIPAYFLIPMFQSCYSLSGIRRAAFPFFVGTAKVEIFFNLSSFLFFIFQGSKTFQIFETLTTISLYTPFKKLTSLSLSLILFLRSGMQK